MIFLVASVFLDLDFFNEEEEPASEVVRLRKGRAGVAKREGVFEALRRKGVLFNVDKDTPLEVPINDETVLPLR